LNWGSTASPYWSTSNASSGLSALSYMPEVPWNDTCTNPVAVTYLEEWATYVGVSGVTDAEKACNFVVNYYYSIYRSYGTDLSGFVDITGGSGGASSCTTSNGSTVASCSGGYAKPSWQTGVTGIPSDGKRDLPDVSFFASNGFLGSAYLVCVSANGTCSYSTTSEPTSQEVGGTSASSPAMAGVMALINQKAGSAQGNPNSEFYALAAKQTYANCTTESVTNSSSCYFNDIDTSTIAVPCTSGSPNCTVSHSGDSVGILSGWAATTGYDLATGLGSLNVANVVNAWPASIGTATATMTVTPSATSINSSQSLTVTGTVSGTGATPTGKVTLSGGGYTSAAVTLSSGSYSITIPAYRLSAGSDTLTASYSGDAVYAATSKSATVTVTQSTFTLSASNVSVAAGVTSGNVSTVTVSAVNGYTGTVTLTAAVASSPSGAVGTPTFTGSTVTIGSGSTSGTGTVTVSTTAVTAANRPGDHFKGTGWFTAAGGTAIAALLFFFLPLPSRRWRQMLSAVLLTVAVSFAVVGCGGGGGGGGGSDTTTTKTTPTVTVTPTKAKITVTDTLLVSVSVASSSTGTAPTGTVSLTSGSYTSTAQTLSGGTVSILIPANSLTAGATDTLSVSYGGDSNYNSASGSATVTVNKAATTTGAYTVTVTGTGNDAAATTATTTFALTVN
jgi:hypothetical protein